MKVLMFGWEFPPMSSGGLGTACYGLTRGLSNIGVDISFVLPYAPIDSGAQYVKLIPTNNLKRIKITGINSILQAYVTSSEYKSKILELEPDSKQRKLYGEDLYQEVYRFSQMAGLIAEAENFDVIHCHDWMTFMAGAKAKEVSGKPLIIQIHSTEFDRTGGNVNQIVYDIERWGMHTADLIIAVSQFTKNKLVEYYGIHSDKVVVIHNAVDLKYSNYDDFKVKSQDKIVLFLGRLTMQKGLGYFIDAAKKCLEIDPNIKFVIAGTGDMKAAMIEKVANMGISDKVLFAGFVPDSDLDKMYQIAQVYVMPSVSEPFGITPLEAMKNGTPVIISKQSGVSEVIKHCLKVDFWDINQLVDKIIAVLHYDELHTELKHHGGLEIKKFTWNEPAKKCLNVYNRMVGVV